MFFLLSFLYICPTFNFRKLPLTRKKNIYHTMKHSILLLLFSLLTLNAYSQAVSVRWELSDKDNLASSASSSDLVTSSYLNGTNIAKVETMPGSIFRFTLRRINNRVATTKLGIEMPIVITTRSALSSTFPRLYAARQPIGIPIKTAFITAKRPTRADTGKRSWMISITGRFFYILNETPKSPLSTSFK